MSFEYLHAYEPPEVLPQHQGLHELAVLPLVPLFMLAGGGAAGATINMWLNDSTWSIGEYNHWMKTMNDTIGGPIPGKPGGWDKLGWEMGCWQKHPRKRKEWQAFWGRFAAHYRSYPRIVEPSVPPWVRDSEEKPARDLMKSLRNWGWWLNKTCGAPTEMGTKALTPPEPDPPPPGGGRSTDWGSVAMWGALGVGGIVVLSLVSSVKGAFKK